MKKGEDTGRFTVNNGGVATAPCYLYYYFKSFIKMKAIGKKIRLLRYEKGWRQEDVAAALKISVPALSKIESGITDLNLSRADQIAELFGISLAQLIACDSTDQALGNDLETLSRLLEQRDAELITLQKKVIALLEELKMNPVS